MGPKLRKAARGKHRWVGIQFHPSISSKDMFCTELETYLGGEMPFDSLDFGKNTSHTCIIKVRLIDYSAVRVALKSSETSRFVSLTSSGKLRLVRERLRELN